ncbi:MAG TPA: L-2-hydroxyglutarate oxidase [Solirubrobacteraceae bacterium]|nr:L-2-hydroxyglutarate oxidase [Solirubrobacteraceae bacterium]
MSDADRLYADPPERCDLAIVGGGIVGLAVAREMIRRSPRASVAVLEREARLGSHQSGHNSGVLHAGIYYAPGSLKARLCVEGAAELYRYCEQRGIAHRRSGKLILARDAAELSRLRELERRGRANGVRGLRWLEAGEIESVEPHALGVAALHSPDTGIVDFTAVTDAYADDVAEMGGSLAAGCGVESIAVRGRTLRLEHARGSTEARDAIFCAGAWADRLAVAAGAPRDPRIVPVRGAYLRVDSASRHLVRSLIYPVPDPSLPFLGVHLTRHIDGELLIGPTALVAGARDAYSPWKLRGRDLLETLSWPGTWRMLASSWRPAADELRHALRPASLLSAAARYVPELARAEVRRAFTGIRAQALGRDGRLVDDFVVSATPRALHVRNAPSPAATASLALARHVADQAERAFGRGT